MLVGVEGPLAGVRYRITETGLRVGRDPANEVCVPDVGVSRQHARVLLHHGAVWVQDTGSRNGVFVNGERVPDNRQCKIGDRISVGGHTFDVMLESGAALGPPAPTPRVDRSPTVPQPVAAPVPQRIAPPEPAEEEPRKGWSIWPFVLAAFFAFGIVACFGAYAMVRTFWAKADAPEAGHYSLSTVVDPPAEAAPTPISVSDALKVAAGDEGPKVPPPPPGATGQELTARAHGLYDAGRLPEALVAYQQALQVDPACEVCTVRVERLKGEIAQKAQQQLDAGTRAYDAMQYPEASAAFETVLALVPDPADPVHQRAVEGRDKAAVAMKPGG